MKTKNRNKKAVVIILVIIDLITFILLRSATKLIYDYGADNFQTYISNCSYYAVEDLVNGGCDFSNLFNISRDSEGNIQMISANTYEINLIAKDLSTYCFNHMDEYMKSGFTVPLGVFSGINLLAGLGPKIHITIMGNLSVCCELKRTFQNAGINQTRYTLSVIITTEVYVYSFSKNRFHTCSIEIPLIDNLIVGKVPETFINAEIVGESVKKE